MKKYILVFTALLSSSLLVSQTEFDALKIVQTDILGTARYMSMAGAFGALGGDASAIKDNPAGLGIYRSSEMTGTVNLMFQNSNSKWNATERNDNTTGVGFNNLSYIKFSPTMLSNNSGTGLLSSNWSFSYNRLRNFDRVSTIKSGEQNSSISDYMAYFTGDIKSSNLIASANPYNNISIPWISELAFQGYLINETVNPNTGLSSWSSAIGNTITPSYTIRENGHIDEYSIGWAGNFSNIFYVGATFNIESLEYTANSQYIENYGNSTGMTLTNVVTTSGTGFNLNIGAILRPTDFLRVGASIHSPTFFALTDNNYANLDYYFSSTMNGNLSTPMSADNPPYSMTTPWKFNGSAAIIIGTKGLLSAEYNYSSNTHTTFMDENGNSQSFEDENTGMKTMLKDVQTWKFGAEYKLTPNLSLRAGYATVSAGSNPLADKLMRYNTTRTDTEYFLDNGSNYITAGFGYRENNWFVDFAYVNKTVNETFYPYNSNKLPFQVSPASVSTTTNNLVFTVGYKF